MAGPDFGHRRCARPLGGFRARGAGRRGFRPAAATGHRTRGAETRGAHPGQVGRHAFQRSGPPAHVSYFERHSAGRRAPGGLRGEIHRARHRPAVHGGLYRLFGFPLRQRPALCRLPHRCGASRLAEQTHQGLAADGAGHCAADLHDSDCFDPARQVARHPADGTGRLGGRADADFP